MKSHISESELIKFSTCNDYLVSGEQFDLYLDSKTELLQTFPQPNIDKISSYYESDDYLSHNANATTIISKIYDFAKVINIRSKYNTVAKYAGNNIKLLDIGCGIGDFLYYAKQHNVEVDGIEPNDSARDQAEKRLGQKINSGNDLTIFHDDSKDVITMWHVLEHRYDINETLINLKRIVKKDGYIVLALPNYKSFDGKYYKSNWAAYDVPRHLFHFSQNTIQYLADKFDFKLVETKPMWFDSFYVSILSEKNSNKKLSFFRGILIGLVSNISYLFTKQSSSHIYVLKNHKN